MSFLPLCVFLAATLCCKLLLKSYIRFSVPLFAEIALIAIRLLPSKLLSGAGNSL